MPQIWNKGITLCQVQQFMSCSSYSRAPCKVFEIKEVYINNTIRRLLAYFLYYETITHTITIHTNAGVIFLFKLRRMIKKIFGMLKQFLTFGHAIFSTVVVLAENLLEISNIGTDCQD